VPIDFAIGCPSEAGDPDLVPLLEAPNVQIEAARMLPPSRLRDFVGADSHPAPGRLVLLAARRPM